VAHSVVFGSWAPRIPAVKDALQLSDGDLGVGLTGMAAGVLVGARVAGAAVERVGSRAVLRLGTAALCLAVLGPAVAPTFPVLVVALLAFGFAGGLVDVTMNAQAVAVQRGYGRPIMSSLHGIWSATGLVAALLAGLAAHGDVDLTAHFTAVAVAAAALGVLGLRDLLPTDAERVGGREHHVRVGGRVLWSAPVVLLGLIGFSTLVGEGSVFDWSAVYLRDSLGAGDGLAAAGFAAFALAMTAVRFVGDRLTVRFGPVSIVRWGAVAAAVGFGAGLAADDTAAAIAGCAFLGGGLSLVFPLAMTAAGSTGLGATGPILARVATFAYVGSVVGPVAIGFLAERVGLGAALYVPVALAAVVGVLAGRIRPART
jgi:predicted MFS family arabinose efflux permease